MVFPSVDVSDLTVFFLIYRGCVHYGTGSVSQLKCQFYKSNIVKHVLRDAGMNCPSVKTDAQCLNLCMTGLHPFIHSDDT